MVVFGFLILSPIIVSLITYAIKIEKDRANKIIVSVFFFFLFVLLSLRSSSVGNDTLNYIDHFLSMRSVSFATLAKDGLREIGYKFLSKVLSVFVSNPQVFLSIVSLFMIFPIYKLYKECSEDALLTLSFFCILPNFAFLFTGIRQSLAISFVVLSYYFIRKRKIIKFILIIVVACMFHSSAIFALLLYPVYHMRIKLKSFYLIVPLIILTYVFRMEITPFLIQFTQAFYQERYMDIVFDNGSYLMLLLFSALLVFSYVVPNESKMDEETFGLRNYLIVSVFIQCLSSTLQVMMRINYYFILFLPILLPKIISSSDRYKMIANSAKYIMATFFIVYSLLKLANGDSAFGVFPFRFFWQ